MAYYLTIKDKNSHKILDINNLEEFKRISRFKDTSYSLEELDNFTSKFENEIELKKKLYENRIINEEDIIKDISIRMKSRGSLEKVMYGLIYRSIKKYLDEYYLRTKILELHSDKTFLNKLITHYRSSHSNQESIAQIRALLLGYIGNDINIYNALNTFYIREIYNIDKNNGEAKIKYKSLHDLGMFVYNYLENSNKSKISIENENYMRLSNLRKLQETLLSEKVYVKKKIKKTKQELEGQISFFDYKEK